MAKSIGNRKNERRHFRHELGSALAILEHGSGLDDRTCDLAAYLAACSSWQGKAWHKVAARAAQARRYFQQQPGLGLSARLSNLPNPKLCRLLTLGEGLQNRRDKD